MVPAHSHKVSRVSWYSGSRLADSSFAYGAFCTSSGWLSQTILLNLSDQLRGPNPGMHAFRFGLFRFRSPLLTESLVVFSSSGYLDVSVHHRVPSYVVDWRMDDWSLSSRVSPIQISPDHRIFAPPRSFSQLITSFIGS